MAERIPRTPCREQDPKVRARNFDEVSYGYNMEEAQLEQMQAEAIEQQNMVAGIISETREVISVYSDQIEEAEAAALEYEAAIAKKEADIAYLKQRLAEEQALSRAAANGVWRDISQVTFEENDRRRAL